MEAMRSPDLHGNVPDDACAALLLIDVINDLEFEGGERLLKPAVRVARRIAALARQARRAGVPVVYVNDNFGRWRSDFRTLVTHCLHDGVRGEPVARLLTPEEDDYFVLKPKHSGFFGTTLDLLLAHLGARRLVLTGLTTDACVLFTANDAYMREYELHVPADCVASMGPGTNARTLAHMARVLKADITPSGALDLPRLASPRPAPRRPRRSSRRALPAAASRRAGRRRPARRLGRTVPPARRRAGNRRPCVPR
jgi:nicotinamidase-related amidase